MQTTFVISARLALLVLLLSLPSLASADPPLEPDPNGILRKPIPDKLVVLTFDDGPASHATIVAPLLKSLGFGASFYVCDFDSFNTRKDWYLTWRQMRAMAKDGFEIGNHTKGHVGGASIEPFLAMEDELLANHVPKPTTIAWPVYQANPRTYAALAANGYVFGRGGHSRAYRPTVDNPFDIPSFSCGNMETFVDSVRQATGGRIVVLTFHGIPDMEHPAVGLDPSIFKVMMHYLKENNYKAIALRDLAEYIDPVKAAKLPPTANDAIMSRPRLLVNDDKPYVPASAGKPKRNRFTWSDAVSGKWSEGAKWSSNGAAGSAPVAAGEPDYVFTFNKSGNYTVTNDLNDGLLLNQLNFSGQSLKVDGKTLAFVANPKISAGPRINQSVRGETTIAAPVKLAADTTIDVAEHGELALHGLLSGPGRLIKRGDGQLRIANPANTFSGGTTIDRGSVLLLVANKGLGSGPIMLNADASLDLEHVDATNPLILNGGTINAGNGFGDSWNAPIVLNGNTKITSYADFALRGNMSGSGGFTQFGSIGGFGPVNSGQVTLSGDNTYAGPTIVHLGTLRVLKAHSLYHAETANWTAAKITVEPAARLRLSVGGPGEFAAAQIDLLLKNLTAAVNDNGLMARSVLCLDTANATEPVTISQSIADSAGPGGGAFVLRKCGAGTLRLAGANTYTGQTVVEAGTLSVASINRVAGGVATSSMGAPTNPDNGEIVFGNRDADGECTLIYTGTGETTDRELNLAGKRSTVTFDQSGSGLLKFTSGFTISGYGHDKTLVLRGDTAGQGEFAGEIADPYDRARAATTALVKTGSGTWTLSGTNTYTAPTTVAKGTLSLATARSLGPRTDVIVERGAALDLEFQGPMNVGSLSIDGKRQPPGEYGSASFPTAIRGPGVLKVDESHREGASGAKLENK